MNVKSLLCFLTLTIQVLDIEFFTKKSQQFTQEKLNLFSGFNHGYNIAESTNFATERWIEYGKRCRPCDCDTSRVKFNMDPFVKRFQPEKYEKWLLHQDIAPHPEDPPDRIKEIEIRAKDPVVFAREQEKKRFPEMTKFDNLSDDQTILDVFRHVDFNNLRVYRVPETKEFYKGKEELEAFLQKSNVDIGEFIEKGQFSISFSFIFIFIFFSIFQF